MDWLNHPAYVPARDRLIGRLKNSVFLFKHLSSVAFLCGKADSSNRDILRDYLKRYHPDLFVFYAEHVWHQISGIEDLNSLQMEEQLARLADLIIVVVESPGTFAELGAFSLSGELREKLLPILDRKFEGKPSFINSGPITWINRESRYGKAIYAGFDSILTIAAELDTRLKKLPSRGRLIKSEAVRDLHEKPKHLLFLLCDLLAIIGPATAVHCKYYLDRILDKKPIWSVASLLGLGISLKLISEIPHATEYGHLYYRPLLNGQLESYQHQKMFELSLERAKFLSIYQKIEPLSTIMLTKM